MDNNDASTPHVNAGSDLASLARRVQPSDVQPQDETRERESDQRRALFISLLDKGIEVMQRAVGSELQLSNNAELLLSLGTFLGVRFTMGSIVEDLRRALPVFQRVLDLSPDKDPNKAEHLHHLGRQLRSLFERGRALIVLDCAILVSRCVVNLTSNGHPREPDHLGELGISLGTRFRHNDDPADIEQAIVAYRRAAELAPDGHSNKAVLYNNLGTSLRVRFERSGEFDDIEQSVVAQSRAVELTPDGHSNKPGHYNNLGDSLLKRFERNSDLDDIARSITAFRHAVDLSPIDHDPARPIRYNSLGYSLRLRFQRTGTQDDIEQSIAALRRAVELSPDGHPDKPSRYNGLGSSLGLSFEHNGNLDDIKQSIAALRRAVELTPDGHSDKPGHYNDLSVSLQALFKRNGELDDIERSIAAARRAVELTPDGDPGKPVFHNSLGTSLQARFKSNSDLDDIDQSVAALRRAIELVPGGHPNEPECYNNLGVSLQLRFRSNGNLDDIEQSITALRRAIELTLDGHPGKPLSYNGLGNSLQVRFRHNRDLYDIEQSIAAYRRAVELTPNGHPNKPACYTNLGVALRERFDDDGDLNDIEQSITVLHRAVLLIPDDHVDKARCYNNLGTSLQARFRWNNDSNDIEQSIAALRRAVELTLDGHTSKPNCYNNLGISLRVRFERNGDPEDIEQSIAALHRAVEQTPDGHSEKPLYYGALGLSLTARCRSNPTQLNFDMAVEAYMGATARPLGSSSIRLLSARHCVALHCSHPTLGTTQSLLVAHSYVVSVLPEVVWLGHDIHRRFDESAQLGKLVNAAVAAAIVAVSLEQAVEWLEAGRALIWSQMLSLRTPLDELQERQPSLAELLRNVQLQLQQSAPSSFALARNTFDDVVGLTTNPQADHHRGLAIEHGALLKKIRDCVGFEDFLRPQRLSSLIPSATEPADGPIVFLHVNAARCDALGILPGGAIILIHLPDLSLERAHQLRSLWERQLKGHSVRKREPGAQGAHEVHPSARPQLVVNPKSHPLRHSSLIQEDDSLDRLPALMWEWIVRPVLKALNISNPASRGHLPHVTWCPTGPLTQLPLHTAGLYSTPNGPRAFNLIVSSYTPSLSAFRRSHEAAMKPKPVPNALIVTQPASLGHAPLPQTTSEGTCVKNILRDAQLASTLLNHEEATVSSVEGIISQFPWVHLACHGSQHAGDATQSAFALYDGPLSLADLMRTASDDAELAFLSACETATGDASNPEESAHLAAGMLAVGFQGVVATMWSIMDEDAPIVVEAYYRKLLQLRKSGEVGKGQTGAAYALHEAVAQLRAKVGEGSFGRWAPFVHFGV